MAPRHTLIRHTQYLAERDEAYRKDQEEMSESEDESYDPDKPWPDTDDGF